MLAEDVMRWSEESRRGGGVPFGSEENGVAVLGMVSKCLEEGVLVGRAREEVMAVRDAVERGMPKKYVKDVMRNFIPDDGESEGRKSLEGFARKQASRFEDESGVFERDD